MRLVFAAIVAACAAAPALAADLPAPVPMASPWSFTVFGGPSWLDQPVETSFTDAVGDDFDLDIDVDTGYLIGGGMGYAFADWGRAELEVSYAGYDIDRVTYNSGLFNPVDGEESVSALTVMGNVWFGFGMLPLVGGAVDQAGAGFGFSPYLGGGLGVGFVSTSGDTVFLEDTNTALAWQVGAGVRWSLAANIGVDVGYRYRNLVDAQFGDTIADTGYTEPDAVDLSSHNLVVGLSFAF